MYRPNQEPLPERDVRPLHRSRGHQMGATIMLTLSALAPLLLGVALYLGLAREVARLEAPVSKH